MDAYLSMVSNRLNQVMKQLTVIATVFLPLSFLTGFFGQNFAWMVSHLGGLPRSSRSGLAPGARRGRPVRAVPRRGFGPDLSASAWPGPGAVAWSGATALVPVRGDAHGGRPAAAARRPPRPRHSAAAAGPG